MATASEVWKLWRTLDVAGDTDEFFDDGDASAVTEEMRRGISRVASGDRATTTRIEFMVIAVTDASPTVQVPNEGTYTARMLQIIRRDREIPNTTEALAGSEIETAIPIGEIQTIQCTGGVEISIEIDTVAGLHADADALEVWLREVAA